MNRNTTDEETITRQRNEKKTRHLRSGTKKTDCGHMNTFAKDRGKT